MVTITIDGQTVEAESLEAANREAAKIRRKAKKDAQEREVRRVSAEAEAASNLARIVDTVCAVLDDGSARYFRIWTLEDHDEHNPIRHLNLESDFSVRRQNYRVETESGMATGYVFGYRIDAMIENGAGFCMALHLDDGTNESYWASVGVCGDMIALRPIPKRIAKMMHAAADKRAQAKQ